MAVSLPKHVAFKGDNGKYLSAQWIEGYPYLMFSASDISDDTVAHEIFANPDGTVRIKSVYHGKFWRRSPNWIWADNDDTEYHHQDTLFWPVKLEDNVIALRNNGNNQFCKRLTTEGKTSCLNAAVHNITPEARLVVEELVLSRLVSDVIYHLGDAKFYNTEVVKADRAEAVNSTERPSTQTLNCSYTETKTNTWSDTISLKLGVKATLKAGIPFVVDGKTEVSAEVTNAFQFGETKTETKTTSNTYTVTVSPKSVATVTMMATRGSYDIPFNYKVTDQLLDGSIKTYYKDDGIYTGNSALKFKTENTERLIE